MAFHQRISLSSLFFLIALFYFHQIPVFAAKKSYIVYLGFHSKNNEEQLSAYTNDRITESHVALLESHLKSQERAKDAIFYSYTRHINGFAALLEEEDAMKISKTPGVVSVFENRAYKLHTTRSWQFLGLEKHGAVPEQSLWSKANFGEDVIVANLDTGVWPESDSFGDKDMGPIPSRWKGTCQNDSKHKFSCNRKLIGARYFNKGHKAATGNSTINSPRDTDGHGTHTLSTVGGNFVPNVTFHGLCNGTAKGGLPRARVAAYKVCWPEGCFDSDVLAGFEAAINDGVDVISVSLAGNSSDYFNDASSIGAFHAVSNGIVVVTSAGNFGPTAGSVTNIAPWLLTVGASSMDRDFYSYVLFGNERLKGKSLSTETLPKNKKYNLIRSSSAVNANSSVHDANLCLAGSLDRKKVKGNIVVCIRGTNARVDKGGVVKSAGGVGMVLANDISTGDKTNAYSYVLPAVHISYSDGVRLLSYIETTKSPKASISPPITALGTKPAPLMAEFSSQGPNTITPEILKPDITAPGVNVIAAYSEFDNGSTPYVILSGTSMSCPHISGIAGLLKAAHPEWSPSAIKSAIMTTASVLDNMVESIKNESLAKANPFSYGSGHVQANRAVDPGLVYDMDVTDYLNFLCALGYNSTQISAFKTFCCPSKVMALVDLNYPSITVPNLGDSITVTRKVKNVGKPGTYVARVENPSGISVKVNPEVLCFKKIGEEKAFEVILTPAKGGNVAKDYVFGVLEWSDGKHYVRSPITVKSKGVL